MAAPFATVSGRLSVSLLLAAVICPALGRQSALEKVQTSTKEAWPSNDLGTAFEQQLPSFVAMSSDGSMSYEGELHNILVLFLPVLALVGTLFLVAAVQFAPALELWPQLSSAKTVQCLIPFCAFQDNICFTLVILDSFQVGKMIEAGTSFPGWLVGIYKLGSALGGALVWAAVRKCPGLWRPQGLTLIKSGLAVQLSGSAMYSIIVILTIMDHSRGKCTTLQAALISSRFLHGLGSGIVAMFGQQLLATITPKAQRPAQMVNFQLAVTLGIGLGPLVASGGKLTVGLLSSGNSVMQLLAPLLMGPVSPGIALIFAHSVAPSLMDVHDYQLDVQADKVERHSLGRGSEVVKRHVVVAGCLTFHVFRAFVIAGLESATALLCQSFFGWSVENSGIALGCCFLTCYMIKPFYDKFSQRVSLTVNIRTLLMFTLIGSMMLFPTDVFVRRYVPQSVDAFMLLIGCALLFPAFYLSSGVMLGVAQSHVLPAGWFLDLNTMTLLSHGCGDAFGRTLGPPLAVWAVQAGGQWRYACHQSICCFVALLLAEGLLWLGIDRGQDAPKVVHPPPSDERSNRSLSDGRQ